jgi:hypothetical protein
MQRVLARTLGVAAIVAAASIGISGLASAGGDGGDGYTTTTTTTDQPTTTVKATTTESPTTTPREVTTTHKSYPTTTKAPTTTASPTTTPREVTTTAGPTTTTKASTTTSGPTTTKATTTTGPTTTKASTTTTAKPPHKVFVCKYVGKPGVDERLQTGDNPISVDINSLKNFTGIGSFFNDRQGRSVAIAFDTGQPEPSVSECPTPPGGTTTTVQRTTTTVGGSTTTTKPGSTTTTAGGSTTTSTTTGGSTTSTSGPPRPSLFAIGAAGPTCIDAQPFIAITFGSRPDLNGQTGTLSFSTGGSVPLVFQSGATVTVPWPAGAGDIALITYTLGAESATAGPLAFPEDCPDQTTTTTGGSTSTTTTQPGVTTTTQPGATTTTAPGATTTTAPGATTTTAPGGTTTLPATFTFGAAATVCVTEVPTIRIIFQNQFPSLAGVTGTLTMRDINGNVVSTQPLVYQPGATVDILYPGTRVNADGSIADVPGWNLNSAGFWVRDPSDEFLRAGINLTYTVNPTATAFVTYPPESSACANPDGPFPPGAPTPGQPGFGIPVPQTQPGLPATGVSMDTMLLAAVLAGAGSVLLLISRRPRRV